MFLTLRAKMDVMLLLKVLQVVEKEDEGKQEVLIMQFMDTSGMVFYADAWRKHANYFNKNLKVTYYQYSFPIWFIYLFHFHRRLVANIKSLAEK